MKHFFATLILATLCAVTGYAQTIKSLGYNTTNGHVVYSGASQLTFTNPITLLSSNRSIVSSILFLDNTGIEFDGEGFATNFPAIYFVDSERAATTRTNLGLGATWLTNTNATDFRNAIGIDYTSITFGGNNGATLKIINEEPFEISFTYRTNSIGVYSVSFRPNELLIGAPFGFSSPSIAGVTRTNLGLPLQALTNTSNVTMMRALSGSTNTNHPFSGTVSVVGTNNTNTLVFSNGILQSVE